MQKLGRMFSLVATATLLLSGCATKSWVEEYYGTKSAEIDQRFTSVDAKIDQQAVQVSQVESQSSETAQRVDGMGNQLRSLDGSLIEVRGMAAAGQERANAAYQKAEDTNSRLTRLWDSRYKRSPVETVDVRFGFNRWELADAAQNELAGLAKEVKENDKLVVELAGYTDPAGSREYNLQLSQRRVEAVRRFFVERGVQLWRIESVGLGPSGDPGLSNDKKRRVTVTLLTLE